MKVNIIESTPYSRNLEERDGYVLADTEARRNVLAVVLDGGNQLRVVSSDLKYAEMTHRLNVFFTNIRPIKGIDIRL